MESSRHWRGSQSAWACCCTAKKKPEAIKLEVGLTVAHSCAVHVLDRWCCALSVNPRCSFSAHSLEQNCKSGQQQVSRQKHL